MTSISANADGPRDAASRKINHIALPTKYNYQATSVVDSKLLARPRNVGYYHIFER